MRQGGGRTFSPIFHTWLHKENGWSVASRRVFLNYCSRGEDESDLERGGGGLESDDDCNQGNKLAKIWHVTFPWHLLFQSSQLPSTGRKVIVAWSRDIKLGCIFRSPSSLTQSAGLTAAAKAATQKDNIKKRLRNNEGRRTERNGT